MLEIENNFNTRLRIDLDAEKELTPRIVIESIDGNVERTFLLDDENVKKVKEHFNDYISLPKLSKWLDSEEGSKWVNIVTREDLKTMLECVKAACMQANRTAMQANRTANAAVEAASRLSEIYERYNTEEERREDAHRA